MIDAKERYAEVGTNYRFFLAWRHASFAGMLLILFGTLQITVGALTQHHEFAWLIPLLASPLGILLWAIDVRTRDLYHAAIRAGREIEGEAGGFYTELSHVTIPRGTAVFARMSQSAALNVLFLGSSMVLAIIGLALRFNGSYFFSK